MLTDTIPAWLKRSPTIRALETQAQNERQAERAAALEALAKLDAETPAALEPLLVARDKARADHARAKAALESAASALGDAEHNYSAEALRLSTCRDRIVSRLEGELLDERIAAALDTLDGLYESARSRAVGATEKESPAEQRALTGRIEHILHVARPAVHALATVNAEDLDAAIERILKAIPNGQ